MGYHQPLSGVCPKHEFNGDWLADDGLDQQKWCLTSNTSKEGDLENTWGTFLGGYSW